jgi:hypothetical protein
LGPVSSSPPSSSAGSYSYFGSSYLGYYSGGICSSLSIDLSETLGAGIGFALFLLNFLSEILLKI